MATTSTCQVRVDYLLCIANAIPRYRPGDMPFKDTQALLGKQTKNTSLEERMKVFLRVRREFQPVLRHFFTESNKQPLVWYAKRLTYSRSVAVGSIGMNLLSPLLGIAKVSKLVTSLGLVTDTYQTY